MADIDDATTAPVTVPDDGTATEPVVPANDTEARVRAGGEFAVTQWKNAQRELHRQQSKYGKEVDAITDALGGKDALIKYVQRMYRLEQTPETRAIIDEYEKTGKVTPPRATANTNGAGDDEFEEPWTRDLRSLREENERLRADVNSVRGERGVEKVRDNLAKFVEEFPLDVEDRTSLTEALIAQARNWGSSAQGLDALRNTSDYTTFRALALGKLSADQLDKAADVRRKRKQDVRAAAATDVPGRVKTQAREEDAEMSPAEAFTKACREFGHDPYRPLA